MASSKLFCLYVEPYVFFLNHSYICLVLSPPNHHVNSIFLMKKNRHVFVHHKLKGQQSHSDVAKMPASPPAAGAMFVSKETSANRL